MNWLYLKLVNGASKKLYKNGILGLTFFECCKKSNVYAGMLFSKMYYFCPVLTKRNSMPLLFAEKVH
jgi:hypothetical protein